MTKKIEVTQDDINSGVKNDPTCCPIAVAVSKAGIMCPSVTEFSLYWGNFSLSEDRGSCQLPKEAKNFVRNFDAGNVVGPFTFEVELDD